MSLRSKIALLVAQPEESYHTAFIKGFLNEAFADDYDVCIFAMYQRHQSTKVRSQGESNIYSLPNFSIFNAIVILASSIQTPGVLETLEQELHQSYDKPVIFVDEESEYFYNIEGDNYLPIKKMVSHLIEEHGYKDIAFLNGNEFHPHARKRLKGFMDSMEEHGLEVRQDRIFFGDFWYNSGRATAEHLLRDRENLPEAVVCANDYMAIGLIEAFRKAGVRVPEDIAVTGYDNTPEGRDEIFSLTSVPNATEACGVHSMKCLRALFAGEEIQEYSAGGEPIIGRSCGCTQKKPHSEKKHYKIQTDSFDFNEGTLEDDMLTQTDLFGALNTIVSYIHRIKPFEGFHLCLNEEWADENFLISNDNISHYSEQMIDAIQCGDCVNGADRVEVDALFPSKDLLPELLQESKDPRAYFFTPIFFEERNFGYAAVNFGDPNRCYDASYKRWLNAVMHSLECFLRINALSRKNEKLEAGQIRDSMTALYNYKGFLRVVSDGLKDSKNKYIKFLSLELCGLNEVYMNQGTQKGDKIIIDFTQMLFATMGKELMCYLGNGEVVIAEFAAEEETEFFIKEQEIIRQKFNEYNEKMDLIGKLEIVFATHCGQAENEEDLGNLIGIAVSKKNAAKLKARRERESTLTEEEKQQVKVVADILDHNRLIYHFQPIVDAGTGEIFAYEALMRANTKERISPLDILKCAKHLGRLEDVEKATFTNVLDYLETHEQEFEGKKIFINSIPGTKIDEKDDALIKERLQRFKGKVVVELTEQAEVDDNELESLKERHEKLGVDTAVDDYGTGYSNVYNLLRYMPNFVKIDRMLLSDIQSSAQKQHFVKEIIEFSHNNKISVLAEGVETTEELKMVTALGADLIQGYYTARPNAEVLQSIDNKVRSEIIRYGHYAQEKNEQKVFQAGHNGDISLLKLDSSHFSKIVFSPQMVRHQYITITGLPGLQVGVEIEIQDGYSGRIELKDVDLAVYNEHPTIRLGKNCDVTIVLNGENILEQGGILVPESSKLTIQGEGNLTINKIAVNGYGIGNDREGRHGELLFEQDGQIKIQGNVMHGVAIGSGYGGEIKIRRGKFRIMLTGEEAVGIGALYADVKMDIFSCNIDFEIKNTKNVGIGSLEGNLDVIIRQAGLTGRFSGNKVVGIGTISGKKCKYHMLEAAADFSLLAEWACGIGNLSGDTELTCEHFSVKINTDGKCSTALGNLNKTGVLLIRKGEVDVNVNNELDFDIGVQKLDIFNAHSKFIWNGEEIIRESRDEQ